MILILNKIKLKDDDQILKCTSNYETSKGSMLFIKINYLNVDLVKLDMLKSLWQTFYNILLHNPCESKYLAFVIITLCI